MQRSKKQIQTQTNILVAIRIRPLNSRQDSNGDYDIAKVQDNLMIVLDPVEVEFESENKKILDVLHRSKQQRYTFDKIYREHTSEQIYQQTVQPLIKSVINGFNATVFAYGPTGTGKTHTMLGNQQIYGLNVLAINNIFDQIQKDYEFQYTVTITYVEIYNEMIRDLLIPSSGYLDLRDDPQKGIVISGVTQFKAESTQQVMQLLLIGNKRRTTQATNANLTSSRSHAVFQITVSKTPKTKNTNIQTLIGKLSLIDLAGSQRGTVTQNRGIRLMQGAKINRSLLALANCINALGDKNKKGFFVPYRDSKLTRLLKDSLGGNCKTVMIATVSPSSAQFQQTINTLKYANRAKNIKTKQVSNKKLVTLHVKQYKNIINDLRNEIQQLKIKLHVKGDSNQQIINKIEIIDKRNEKKGQNICTCGRGQEDEQISKIQTQIFQNFNERIQLRRAMMEIEEQNSMNILQIKKRQGQVLLLKKSQPSSPQQQRKLLQQIKQHQDAIGHLKINTHKNTLKKQIMNVEFMSSMTATKSIRDSIPKRIKYQNNRSYLELIIKNHVFQLQNIELQINLQIQEKIIADLKNIVNAQRKTITDNGIDTIRLQDEFEDGQEVMFEIDASDMNNIEDTYGDGDYQQIQQFQQAIQNTKQQARMNRHFGKRQRSANKVNQRKLPQSPHFSQSQAVKNQKRKKQVHQSLAPQTKAYKDAQSVKYNFKKQSAAKVNDKGYPQFNLKGKNLFPVSNFKDKRKNKV